MNDLAISAADVNDADLLATLIAAAFQDVAARFGLTRDNCPGHTSFITADEVRRGMGFGNQYFLAFAGELPCGVVAVRQPKGGTGIVEKLAVLPDFRHHGLGRALMEAALTELKRRGATAAEIGIIAEHSVLRAWYETLGFCAVRQVRYDHLPFAVLHLRKEI